MKALRFSEFGLPSVLRIEEIPRPEPRDGETVVQVKAAAINSSDVKNVSGHFPGTTLPRTPGRDFSGIDEAMSITPIVFVLIILLFGFDSAGPVKRHQN
jgi:NADPH:quinone reductase-like Zn-dependent oxidoreductase